MDISKFALVVFLTFVLISPDVAEFVFEESECFNSVTAGLSTIDTSIQISPKGDEEAEKWDFKQDFQPLLTGSGSGDITAERISGDFFEDDFMFGPVSFMDFDTEIEVISVSSEAEFGLYYCCRSLSCICPNRPGSGEIRISGTPVPNAVFLALIGVAGIGWLRRRLTI